MVTLSVNGQNDATDAPPTSEPGTKYTKVSFTPITIFLFFLYQLSGGSFYAFGLPLRYVSNAFVMQTQTHKRSHIPGSAQIRLINVTQPH